MTYYFFMDKFGMLGYTTEPETVIKFIKQRGVDNHHVVKLKSSQMGEEFKQEIEHFEAMEMYGSIIFESEIEYFYSAMSQYLIDFKGYVRNMLEMLPMLKISENEKLTLLEYFKIIKNKLAPLDDVSSGEVDYQDVEYNDYLLMNIMVRSLIK